MLETAHSQPDAAFMDRWEAWRVFAVGITWLAYGLRSRAAYAEALRACAETAADCAADEASYVAWKVARDHGAELGEEDLDLISEHVRSSLSQVIAAARDAHAAALADVAAFEGALTSATAPASTCRLRQRGGLTRPARASPGARCLSDYSGATARLLPTG